LFAATAITHTKQQHAAGAETLIRTKQNSPIAIATTESRRSNSEQGKQKTEASFKLEVAAAPKVAAVEQQQQQQQRRQRQRQQ